MSYHEPVLLKEAVDALNVKPGGIYVDVTFGGGGHTREILSRMEGGKLFAFDQDPDVLANVPDDDRFTLVEQNFRFAKNYLRLYQALPAHGLLADLGVSSHQFDEAKRGFSIRFDADLDMRMNGTAGATAKDVLNLYEEEELTRVFKFYGELKNARNVAREIVSLRADQPFDTTEDLKARLKRLADKRKENQWYAQLFQALRIEVNDELAALKELLLHLPDIIAKGGKAVFISYHSLEDRLVKNFFRSGNLEGKVQKDFFGNVEKPFNQIHSKVVLPTEEEIERNPRARSAKMRIAERL